jgi:acyl-CoA thioesterase FadM
MIPGDPRVDGLTVEYRVRFDEAGPEGVAPSSMLLRYAQDCAWRHSEVLGFGREWYAERGLAWLVRAIRLEERRPVATGATLAVATAITGFRRIMARRRTVLADAAGTVAIVETDWVMTDRRGAPTRVPADFPALFAVTPPSFEPFRVAPAVPPPTAARSVITVRRADLDPMGHANNGAYVDWIREALPPTGRGPGSVPDVPRTFLLEYLAPTRPGAALTIESWPEATAVACRLAADGIELLRARVEPADPAAPIG